MEHVKQENNISEENINAVSSDPKPKESQTKIYRCSTCSFQTRYKAYISQHENIHLPWEDRPTARCLHCGNIYLSKIYLSRHLRRKHGYSRRGQPINVINYGCVKCNYTTDNKDSFSEHCLNHVLLNSKVAYKKRHECPTCCAKFVVQNSLNVHRITVHKGTSGNEKKTEEDNEIILVQKKLQQYMDKYNENADSISLAAEDLSEDSVTIRINFDAPLFGSRHAT
ncbi:zinc finger protein 761-like isoform X1 [Sitophilus oryzae]|uniref:Zinc finger protein 761-like isoform X1 n=1 Tax=Sitophilus oryzae TaxID=7048 RepID=A0A6J2X900_SITOR|nr:zinc finger protein 761-like isoform X1 [Sitophilus oryzae]